MWHTTSSWHTFVLKSVMGGLLIALLGLWGCSDAPTSDDSMSFTDPPPPCSTPGSRGCWKTYASAPTKRQEIQPAVLDGKIYLVGGLSGTSFENVEVLSSVEVYDSAKDTWSTVTSLPEARHHVAVAAVNGKLYACGGMTGAHPSQWTEQDALHEFDPRTQTWTQKTSMPSPRGEHLGIAFNGKVFFIGGRDENGHDTGLNEMYDPVTDLWTERARMPTPRRSFSAAVLDSLIYIVGGRLREESARLVNTTTVEAYSPESDLWYSLANLPEGRAALSLGVLRGKLYAMGGEFFSGSGGVYSQNQEYDPATDSWRSVKSMDRRVHGTGAVTVEDTIFVLGGATRVAVFSTDLTQGFVIDS